MSQFMNAAQDIPRLRVSTDGPLPDIALGRACARFAEAGIMHFERVLEPDHVRTLLNDYTLAYAAYHRNILHANARHVGDRRNMITVAIAGAFNDPLVYANPAVMPVIEALLGAELILGSFVAVTSLPGAADQDMHLDMPLLFNVNPLGSQLPPYCLTLVIPLVEMNAKNGTTAYHPGSHATVSHEPPATKPVLPEIPPGDALLFDCRVWHGGTANRSDEPRPVLYNSYQRPWFRDEVNFNQQVPLQIPAEEWDRVPDRCRHLFGWSLPVS
jgi:ectoine hydroxylase-related dioxygenase (phytanoyl-CoA dioxygenase family)